MTSLGQPITFIGAFDDDDGTGLTGLTVTVDVVKPDGSAEVTGASATSIGNGLYRYTVAGSDVDAAGWWVATFKTASSNAAKKNFWCEREVSIPTDYDNFALEGFEWEMLTIEGKQVPSLKKVIRKVYDSGENAFLNDGVTGLIETTTEITTYEDNLISTYIKGEGTP